MPDAEILRDILDSQLEMVCRYKADGTILFANAAYGQMMGRPHETLKGLKVWDLIPASEHTLIREQLGELTPQYPSRTIENRLDGADGNPHWTLWRNHALAFDAQGRWQIAQSTGIDITERKVLEDRLRLLVEELNHRVKNTLMVVQAMAWQSFRGSDVPTSPVENFTARLHALAAAHTVLSQRHWAGARLAEVVRKGLTICSGGELGSGGARRISASGPELLVKATPTVSLVMVLHELTTNAIKYGALSNTTGTVAISWAMRDDGSVALQWREQGGPAMTAPTRSGFGSRLIRDAIMRQLSGEAAVDHAGEGLVAHLVLPACHFDHPGAEDLADHPCDSIAQKDPS